MLTANSVNVDNIVEMLIAINVGNVKYLELCQLTSCTMIMPYLLRSTVAPRAPAWIAAEMPCTPEPVQRSCKSRDTRVRMKSSAWV